MEKFPEDNSLKKEEKQSEEKDKNNDIDALDEDSYLPNYIKRYGKEIGLPNLKMHENDLYNICSLCFSESITVDIVYNEKNDQCFLASTICIIPNNDREKFYEQLLISNNTYNENGGVILGIDEDANSVVLSYTFIASTFSYLRFKNVLNNFVDIAEKNILKYKEI
jgi:hypothetical protein